MSNITLYFILIVLLSVFLFLGFTCKFNKENWITNLFNNKKYIRENLSESIAVNFIGIGIFFFIILLFKFFFKGASTNLITFLIFLNLCYGLGKTTYNIQRNCRILKNTTSESLKSKEWGKKGKW